MTSPEPGSDRPALSLLLLAGQAVALGLSTVWITVSATSIFLDAYGADALPITYIGAAAAGAAVTALVSRVLRTQPLPTVAARVLTTLVVALLASWVLLSAYDATWVSFVLVVLIPVVVPVGFVFIVGQAGMLLDVRQLKSSYPRVIAGFASGFFVGGLVGPALLSVLDPQDLLLCAAVAVVALIVLVGRTRRSFPEELSHVADHGPERRPTMRSLLSNRYVQLIIAFQMLSAIESQWLDFLVNDRAAQRYTQTSDLAAFLSRFFAIAYGADILFLVLIAGLLLRHFGLRYGLLGNPGVVLVIVLAVVATTVMLGSGATLVFVLIVSARVSDLTLADGAARASLSAAYQAVPSRDRTAAQALVEGLGVPVAIGFSGVVLLVMRATIGTGGLALPVSTAVVVMVWGVVAVLVYRDYRRSLLANLRRRVLDPTELSADEPVAFGVIDRLLESDDDHEVSLGLEALARSDHPDLLARLASVATTGPPRARVDALELLVLTEPAVAREAAIDGLDHDLAAVRAAGVRAIASTGLVDDLGIVRALTGDPDDDVVVAAYGALHRLGDTEARLAVSEDVARFANDSDPARRALAARILAECDSTDLLMARSVLEDLLDDTDPLVANAALTAIGDGDESLLGSVVGRLEDPHTAAHAVDALVRAGESAIEWSDRGLDGSLAVDARAQMLLARTLREIGSDAAAAVLRRHLDHGDRQVGLAVMAALGALGPVDGDDPDVAELVPTEVRHAARVLQLLQLTSPSTPLHLALLDQLELVRRRTLAALAIQHGADRIGRVAFQLGRDDPRAHAMAMEWLEVTLPARDKAAVALLDPDRAIDDQLRACARAVDVRTLTLADGLLDLIEDPRGRWRSAWLTSCALLAAAEAVDVDLDQLVERLERRGVGARDEKGLVAETLDGIEGRRRGDHVTDAKPST